MTFWIMQDKPIIIKRYMFVRSPIPITEMNIRSIKQINQLVPIQLACELIMVIYDRLVI